ncbi:MAG: Redoxin domain protein [Verrucomicrobia bacterium]|nr:Redoxin domain protein [Verrucomicrobiota bacterium]
MSPQNKKSSRITLRVALALMLGIFTASRACAEIKVGDVFPSLADAKLTGGPVPETAGKIVLVDFWASWCAPCKASFPIYGKIFADYSPRGLVLVAVSVDEKAGEFNSFVNKWKPPFPALLDSGKQLVSTVRVPAMPTSYLLGRDGRVRFIHMGFHGNGTERVLRTELETLFKETP